ncbi:MAG: aldehyde dehydrogenase [Ruminococcaceae bacterium]|nr:aldehyde dehydrogenase [Oscillospiraceae bacterium]
MEQQQISRIVEEQRAFFESGKTLSIAYRKRALTALRAAIVAREADIEAALFQDLGKSDFEGYMCEVGMALDEISYMLGHIDRFAKEKRVHTPLAQFASRSYVKPSPYGVTLIMSPWNYPFLLTIDPLIDALAAGNTAVLKPGAYAPATASIIKELIESTFLREYVAVVTGGRAENACLLDQKFDYIFFTGSKSVGKEVMKKAAEHLTPVTLELGGKSPCIVDETADLALAARRIAFGKYLNCGQTCVAPDYVICHTSVRDRFVELLKNEIVRQFGADPLQNPDFGHIINQKHFERILSLIDAQKVVHGGRSNADTLQIEPTVMTNVTWQDAVMGEEIFGPVLPILTFESMDEVIQTVNSYDSPLALYLFSSNKKILRRITAECRFGGGCVNDVIIHLATAHMGFGGVGESGMGSYHGKAGFDTFSHYKSIVDKKTWIDLPMRYQPYNRVLYAKLLRLFLK